MRLIQHKREAYWFYRFLSLGYDRWVNPLFWTPAMRARGAGARAARRAGLDDARRGRRHRLHDRGDRRRAWTPARVTMLDQSPHQLARSRAKPALAGVPARARATPRALPFADDAFDRYVSAGSIEYWPDPQRGIAEAYRVLRAGRRRRW